MNRNKNISGFTLIELSIVLVIIGLIVGGILVGQDLIAAAAIRAQISQIERYNTAVNTFRGKYGFLPGDIPDPNATQFGFVTRGTSPGQGDGNGVIEGSAGGSAYGQSQSGEELLFWEDLGTAKLIDGNFNTATATNTNLTIAAGNVSAIDLYYPRAKIGAGNYVYAYRAIFTNITQLNYFGISIISQIGSINSCAPCMASTPGITVQQAYNIDKKVDDGLPLSGKVTTAYLNASLTSQSGVPARSAGGGVQGASGTTATNGSSTTCYDNGFVAGVQQYSTGQSNGGNLNCALSFQFQ